MSQKEIKFKITLDENKMPAQIEWSADDADFEGEKAVQAMMIHLWDKDAKSSLNFELWTKDMLMQHMTVHSFYSLMSMADTYERATRNKTAADMLRQFAHQFAQATKEK